MNALPSDPNTFAVMLAAGEIAPDGTVSSTTQSRPVGASSSGSGRSSFQQVQVIARLDARHVAAGLAGTILIGTVSTPLGAAGTLLSVIDYPPKRAWHRPTREGACRCPPTQCRQPGVRRPL